MIKTKIIYKLNQEQELTPSEKKYLQKWVDYVQNNENCNILNHRDALLP